MDDEIPVKLHFFDDDTITVPFEFQSVDPKHAKDLKVPAIIKDRFSSTPDFSESAKTAVYGLHNKLLVKYKNDPENEPELVLDLSFSRYYVIKPEEGKEFYGFSIVKNDTKHDFYCQDKQVYDNWFDALKRVCILCSFHEDFKAIKMIGRGSFAKVYLVESKTTGKSFAVKAFTKDSMAVTNKANAKPALLNEIDLMRTLDHENIIKLYEVYETDKSIYLVLELIQGKSLYDFLKKANFKEEVSATKIVNMVRSLLDALAYLASKGIMHRDLKPDNILLDKGEKVKIVDFGLATFIDIPSYVFKKCGTPGYIAPEVFKFDEKDPNTAYNDRCDVFSAGCLFYYMLFHSPLFPGSTAGDILKLNKKFATDYAGYNTIKSELENPQGKISKDGLALLQDLIEYDQHKRISASQALNHSYFIPVPMGMQKVIGSNEFIIDNANKFTPNEVFSPVSPLKTNPFQSHSHSSDQVQSPLTPLRLDPFDKDAPSPLLPNRQDRIVKEDSLYLDLGKPEINGRIDTITSGSIGGSLLLNNRAETTNNPAPHPSVFAAGRNSSRGSATKSYKPLNQTGNQQSSFLKAAILKNIQKNSSEGGDEVLRSRFEDMRASRNMSENASPVGKGMSMEQRNLSESPGMKRPEGGVETNENENENDDVKGQLNFDKVEGQGDKLSGKGGAKPRKFQPFAPANLIIPKNENQSDV